MRSRPEQVPALNRGLRQNAYRNESIVRIRNLIEERIAEVLERKRQLFNELIEQNDAPPSLGLSEDDIFGLFNIQARPKRQAA